MKKIDLNSQALLVPKGCDISDPISVDVVSKPQLSDGPSISPIQAIEREGHLSNYLKSALTQYKRDTRTQLKLLRTNFNEICFLKDFATGCEDDIKIVKWLAFEHGVAVIPGTGNSVIQIHICDSN